MSVTLVLATLSSLCVAAPAASPSALADQHYGLRYGPLAWLDDTETVLAAQVRTSVLAQPRASDAAVLAREIEKTLADQEDDGSIGLDTWASVVSAVDLGCSPDRPEIQRAVDYIVTHELDEDGTLGIYRLRALCVVGYRHAAVRDSSLRKLAARCQQGIRGACPWTPIQHLKTLWRGREFVAVGPGMSTDLTWIAENLSEVGCLSYKDPWGCLDLASTIDHPLGRQIVLKQLAWILRSQRPDGTWGGQTYNVLRALVQYDLLEPLRRLPPLPPDWRVVRSIPAPAPNLWTLTWDGDRLWVMSPSKREAIAVSPTDGKVVGRLPLPFSRPAGIACWGQDLAVVKWDPREVVRIDPSTGAIRERIAVGEWLAEPGGATRHDGRLWLADGWNWVVIRIDPAAPDSAEYVLMACPTGGMGTDLAAAGDGIWHFDRGWPVLVETDARAPAVSWTPEAAMHYRNPPILDWGEKPFPGLAGVAWDGQQLWALDGPGQRLCVIEKSHFAYPDNLEPREISKGLPALLSELRFPGPVEATPDVSRLVFAQTVHNPLPVPVRIRQVWHPDGTAWRPAVARSTTDIAPHGSMKIESVLSFDPERTAPLPVRTSTVIIDGVEATEIEHSPPPPILRRSCSAVRVDRSPQVDGRLGLGEYGAARLARGFQHYRGHGPASCDTQFMLAYDDEALYIGIAADEPEPQALVGDIVDRDGEIWRGDEIELFIDVTLDRQTYHQFALGLVHNVQFDAVGGPQHGTFGDRRWDGQWRSAAAVSEGSVVAEVAIPYQTLGVEPPDAGSQWGLNLARNRTIGTRTPAEMSSWCVTYTSFHVPTRFGTVTFE